MDGGNTHLVVGIVMPFDITIFSKKNEASEEIQN